MPKKWQGLNLENNSYFFSIFEPTFQKMLNFLINPLRELNLTDEEFIAMAGIVLWNDGKILLPFLTLFAIFCRFIFYFLSLFDSF